MKICTTMALAALAISLTSCATTRQPQAFHNTDNNAVVIDSLDAKTGQMLEPATSVREENDAVLAKAMNQPKHETAVVILENYAEPRIGEQFRDRGSLWFVCLRSLGYQHNVFLQGQGITDPKGLKILVEYD